jgi:hypothetical protein
MLCKSTVACVVGDVVLFWVNKPNIAELYEIECVHSLGWSMFGRPETGCNGVTEA